MRGFRIVALILAPALLAGCVSQQTLDEKEAELRNTRAELKTCQEQARTDQETRARLEGDVQQCLKIAAASRRTTENLKEREESLRSKLKTELEARDVEISRLRDQLSVRVLDRILFKSGSAQILPEGKKLLDKLASVLASTDDMIRVEGHTDTVPIGERLKEKFYSNWELSASRATSVVRYFEHGHKIEPTRMEAVGFSKYRPVTEGTSPQELQRNRRVEIVLTAPRAPEPAAGDSPSP